VFTVLLVDGLDCYLDGVGTRRDLMGQAAPVVSPEAAEDPVLDVGVEGVGQAEGSHWAQPANGLGLLAGVSSLEEEEVGSDLGAEGVGSPPVEVEVTGHCDRRRRRSWG
jgi:hypothetical protein